MSADAEKRPLHHSEVAKHADKDSLWVIVNGNAYDLTECGSRFALCGGLAIGSPARLSLSMTPPHDRPHAIGSSTAAKHLRSTPD